MTRYTMEINLREMIMLGSPNATVATTVAAAVAGARAAAEGPARRQRGGNFDDFHAPPFEHDDGLPF